VVNDNLIIYEKPKLNKPYLIMGFEGWPDAGKISSGVIGYLREKLSARKLADIKPDDFYLFQAPGVDARRPTTNIKDGLMKTLSIPTTVFWFSKNASRGHDLILSLGLEPELSWNKYVDLVLEFAHRLNVEAIYTVGGTYDAVPHTLPPIITASINGPDLAARIKDCNIDLIDYKGPCSIHTLIQASAGKKNIQAIGLWGHAPHYIQVPNATLCYSILSKLDDLLDLTVDLQDAKKAAGSLDEQMNRIIQQKPELKEYVARMESEYKQGKMPGDQSQETDIIKEVEDFLKGNKGGL
jgi:proteasome assembly chaperone (PAC2) family protein